MVPLIYPAHAHLAPCNPVPLPPSSVFDLVFEGLDGGGIRLLGGEDAVDERFDCLLLLINQLRTYLSSQPSRFTNSRLSRLALCAFNLRYRYRQIRSFFLAPTRSRHERLIREDVPLLALGNVGYKFSDLGSYAHGVVFLSIFYFNLGRGCLN